MEFLDPKKRKLHRQKLFIGYGLIAIALAMMTIVVVFAAYGFDIDRKTGHVIQNGMIIVDAHPESARISINGKDNGTTDKRLSLPAGQYHVELSRTGYRTWRHDVNLYGSNIEQLVYPFLFPSELSTKTLQSYVKTPQLVSQSPDRSWLLTQQPGSTPGTFQIINLDDKTNLTTTITLPAGVLSAGSTHSFSVVEWSTDNTHVLVKHTYGKKVEFIMINRAKPMLSQNITKLFPERSFTSIALHDKRADQFYLYNAADKTLVAADAKSQSISPVANSVLQYKTYQRDVVLYVSAAKNTSKADIHMLSKGRDRVIKTVAVSPTYFLDVADFSGKMYVAVGSTNEAKVYLFLNPLDSFSDDPQKLPEAFRALKLPGLQYMAFSTNARFLEVQAGSKFDVFDAETSRQYRYDTLLPLAATQAATWMDGHRLTLVGTDKKVHVFDFDGTNTQQLNPALTGSVYFDRDYTALYVVAPGTDTKQKAILTRTELKVTTP